jgi:hypothetical protein
MPWFQIEELSVLFFPHRIKMQRLSLFLYTAFGITLLIYALGFISGVYLFFAYGNKGLADFYHEMQKVNSMLLWKAIIVIIFCLLMFILKLSECPAGKITLLFVLLIAAASLFFAADSLLVLLLSRKEYAALDFRSLNRYIERGAIKYTRSTFTFDLGLALYSLFSLSSVLLSITAIHNAVSEKEES